MSNDPNEQTHPSKMSDEDKAALAASDPSAFDDDAIDDDDAGASTGDDAAKTAAAAAPADKGAQSAAQKVSQATPASEGEGEGGKGGEGEGAAASGGDMIPKARFDEVLIRAKDMEKRLAEIEAKQAEAAAAPPRDFDAEAKALEAALDEAVEAARQKYNDGDADLDERDAEMLKAQKAYQAGLRELNKAEAEALVTVTLTKREAEKASQTAQQAWEQAIGTWREANADFLDNAVRRDAVARLLEEHGKDPKLSDAELIAKVQKEAFEAFNWSAPAGGDANDPHANRNAAQRALAAKAAADPGLPAGGTGGRGTQEGKVDLANLKPGKFSSLPAKEQAEMLGGESAL